MSAQPRTAVSLRLPVDLHAELTRRAAEQGVSFNLLLVTLLAGAVSFDLKDEK